MLDQRPKKSQAVGDQSQRRTSNLWLLAALLLLGITIIFHAKIADGFRLMWHSTMGPLVAADWQGDSKSSSVTITGPITDQTDASALAPGGTDEPGGNVKQITVALNSGFKPVNFQISAASIPLELDNDDHLFFKMEADQHRYGTFRFRGTGSYRFELKELGEETLLRVDMNGDGDFSNDGEAYRSPSDAFEVTVVFPMEKVTGQKRPGGDYRLWLYRTPEGGLRQVALTQLTGTVYIDGRGYKAYVVENESIDGNYANDGIYLDWDRDGEIHTGREFIPPGGNIAIGDRSYAFVVRP